jgi:hypothetical protein
MNNGAFIFEKDFFSSEELEAIIILAKTLELNKSKVHSGQYIDTKWF